MLKLLMVVLAFLLNTTFGQVTYSDTPTSQELEQYFFGGIRVLEVGVPFNKELRYQLINMRDMQTIWSGSTGNVISSAPDGFSARFSFTLTDSFADYCGNVTDTPSFNDVKFELFQARLNLYTKGINQLIGSEGYGACIYFDFSFNWGHWTNILINYSEPLPEEGWIPALAFIPNFNKENGVEYGNAETWLVLLVTFDVLNEDTNPNELSQEEVITLLQDYRIDTTP